MFNCLQLQEIQRLNRIYELKIEFPHWVLFPNEEEHMDSKKWINKNYHRALIELGKRYN